jgi:hypothetical protein
MFFPKIHSFLQNLKNPENLREHRRIMSRVRKFLDRLPKWYEASHLDYIGSGLHSIAYSFILRCKEFSGAFYCAIAHSSQRQNVFLGNHDRNEYLDGVKHDNENNVHIVKSEEINL